MVDHASNGMRRKLVSRWDDVKAEIERLQSSAEVRPSDGYQVFVPAADPVPDVAAFELLPVTFNLPERANHPSTDLFVVVEGMLSFRRRDFMEKGLLVTHDFSTRVGYFRRTAKELDHIYGAHFDFALSELAHPVFHGQMKSLEELSEKVKTNYGIDRPVVDHVKDLLKTVRVPTAQMDVFSLFVQLCADHLLHSRSGPEEKAAFNSLLEKSTFCQGAAFQVARLGTQEACQCYRSRHWYPSVG